MGVFPSFGDRAFITHQDVFISRLIQMLAKEPPEHFLPGERLIEEPLHRPVAAALACPTGDPKHGYSPGHRQHGNDDLA